MPSLTWLFSTIDATWSVILTMSPVVVFYVLMVA